MMDSTPEESVSLVNNKSGILIDGETSDSSADEETQSKEPLHLSVQRIDDQNARTT